MFPTSADAGTFWVADIFAAMGAEGKLASTSCNFFADGTHPPQKKYISLPLSVIPCFK